MPVAKVIEIVGQSEQSFEDALYCGVTEAAQSLRGISGVEVLSWTADVENDKIVRYHVTMHLAFQVNMDDEEETQPELEMAVGMSGLPTGDQTLSNTLGAGENVCPACSGSGYRRDQICEVCDGTGRVLGAIGGA